MDKLIKRDWRNWKQPQTPSGSTDSALGESQELGADVQKCSKKVKVPKFAIRSKYKSTPKTPKIPPKRLKLNLGGSNYTKQNLDLKTKDFCDAHVDNVMMDYEQNIEWSDSFNSDIKWERNKKRSRNVFTVANESKDKRLANTLSIMVSKLAEDRVGEVTIGEDEWDIEQLMMRGITKRNIYSCMQSRERENIALVLDSSPSCQSEAELYSKMAYLSAKIGCLDIYLAPNAYVTHKYNIRTGLYDAIFDKDNDKNAILLQLDHLHNFFKNRVVLFFGDWDGQQTILDASCYNEVHWFHSRYKVGEREEYPTLKNYNGNIYSVKTREDLISTIKTIR